ncbi:MAG: tetratricopeptide repeat protein, partial [Saprospiraceae bacterium]|nr:tetratricopeptide repeat protein [Saprospiraceae bacterium]
PYLLPRTLQKFTENFDHFNTVHPIVDATRQQCHPWKTWEEWRRLVGSEKHESLAHYHALALVNHYMGDPIEALRLYDEVLDNEEIMDLPLNLLGQYYFIESAKLFREPHEAVQNFVLQQIEDTREALIAQNALRELYYAGQILWANDRVIEAHELFELADDYLPAAYMQILTLPMTGAGEEDIESKIAEIREREAALPPGEGFLHGFQARPFRLEKPGEDFLAPILHYAHYREISEALAGVRRPDEPFEHQEMWKAFYWLPEDEREIEWQQRREQLAAVNRALLEKFKGNVETGQAVHELNVLEQAFTDKLLRDLWEGTKYLDFEDFKQKSVAWPGAAKDLAALIRTSRRLDDNDKMLLTEYCFLRGSISIEDTFLLYFYIDFVRHPLPAEAAGEGLGEAGKKLIELVVAPNTIFGQILTAFGGGAAVRLFGDFWVFRNREDHIKIDDYRNPASQTPVPPDDFEVFSTNFLRFMSYQRETLGSEKFAEIYPLEGFDDWKKRQ